MNLLFWIVSFTSLTSYLIWYRVKYGNIQSISATVDVIPQPWLFTIMWVLFAIPLGIVANTVLMWIGCAFLTGVAFQPAKNPAPNQVSNLHVVATYSAIIFLNLALLFHYHVWYLSIIGILFALYSMSKFSKVEYHTYWDEIVFAYSALIIILYFNIL